MRPKLSEPYCGSLTVRVGSALRGLTDRELEVLRELAAGRSNAATATALVTE